MVRPKLPLATLVANILAGILQAQTPIRYVIDHNLNHGSKGASGRVIEHLLAFDSEWEKHGFIRSRSHKERIENPIQLQDISLSPLGFSLHAERRLLSRPDAALRAHPGGVIRAFEITIIPIWHRETVMP